MTGDGVDKFFDAVEASREEYEKDYLPSILAARKAREDTLQAAKTDSMNRLTKDLAVDRETKPGFAEQDR